MKNALAVVGIVLLAGCASAPSYRQQSAQLADQGDCAGARAAIERSGDSPGNKAYGIAGMYELCDRDRAKAVYYATISARYGVQAARDFLVRTGYRVPTADLASREPDYPTGLEAFNQGLSEAQANRKRSGRCDSVRNADGSVTTKCRED